MRLFIATELPDDVAEALAETSALLRGCVRGRYTSPDSFHITLAFLGNVGSERLGPLIDSVEEGCDGFAPFNVSLGELGSFGRRSSATLWQGFRNTGLLPELAASIREVLQEADFDFDAKSFLPHVTLMRAADIRTGNLPMPAFAQGTVERVSLYKSDLSGSRPVYEPLHTVNLAKH